MNPKNNLTEEALNLLKEQKEEWKTLGENYKLLSLIKQKDLRFPGYSFSIQYNPNRVTSTSAKTDKYAIVNRKCFLCSENRPAEQRSVLVNSGGTNKRDFHILANPFPVFPEHFTIAAKEHTSQRIKDHLGTFLYFSRLLSDKLTLFYNGPECGASAPDHLHFQAGTKDFMPLEVELPDIIASYGKQLYQDKEISINAIDDGLRRIIHIKGDNESRIKDLFEIFYVIYAQYAYESEPKMNIIAPYNNGWDLLIMLREKHRPEQFFLDEDKLLFSPAGADYGGLCITPVEKDYNRMNETLSKDVFNQVTINEDIFNEIIIKLSYSLDHP